MIERFIPRPPAHAAEDWTSRARLLLGATASVFVLSLVGSIWIVVNGPRENLAVTAVGALLCLPIPWLLRWTRSLTLGVNVLNAVLGSALIGLILNTEGQTLPPYMLLPCLPLLGFLIANSRTGLAWSGFGFGGLAIALLLSRGVDPSGAAGPTLSPESIERGKFFGATVMLGIVTVVCATEGRLRREALRALSVAKTLAEDRHGLVVAQQRQIETARCEEAELRDRFFSHISHELRTPLTALHQFLTLVLDEIPGPLNTEQREFLEIALRNQGQLKRLIDDVTDAAHVQSESFQTELEVGRLVALAEEVCRAIETQSLAKGVNLRVSGDPDLRSLCDVDWFARVLRSLVENAVKFSPEGSEVEISIARDAATAGAVRVSVCDSGPGIDAEAKERIFESLSQVDVDEWQSRQGLGLGLFIARALVQRQGGQLWVESEKGEGATFHFTLDEFDLVSLFRPVLIAEGRLRSDASVIVARIRPRSEDVSLSDRLDSILRDELRIILYPNVDIVLPDGFRSLPSGCRIAVAQTDAAGLHALLRRIEHYFDDFAPFVEAGVAVEFAGRVVSLDADDSTDLDEALSLGTERIETVIADLPGLE